MTATRTCPRSIREIGSLPGPCDAMTGTLHIVATPLGNLGDLSPRAVAVLAAAELICCEDTRRTGRLLQSAHLSDYRLAVCNEHTENDRIDEVIAVLEAGGDVALVSDAGTPSVSDPGARLVRAVIDRGLRVSPVPGPTAAIAALVASGLPTDRFVVEGFLPRHGRARTERLAELAHERRTTVIYEAPHRIERTLDDLREHCQGERRLCLARELTKLHEEIVTTTVAEARVDHPRGEYTLVIEGAGEPTPPDRAEIENELLAALDDGHSTRDAATLVARRLGLPRRTVYELALAYRPTTTMETADSVNPTPSSETTDTSAAATPVAPPPRSGDRRR